MRLSKLGLVRADLIQAQIGAIKAANTGRRALHEKLGKLPFEQLFEPAIEIAERGYAVPPVVAHKWGAAAEELKSQPGYAQAFMPEGRAPKVGEHNAQILRAAGYTDDEIAGLAAAGTI